MQATITNKLVKELKPKSKPYEVWDADLRGFVLRVQASGLKTYYCEYARHKRVKIAMQRSLSPGAARDEARKTLADYVRGIDPANERNKARGATLRTFIEDKYRQWAETNQRRGAETIARIGAVYRSLLDKKLADLAAWDVEKIRSARLRGGRKTTTVNRDIDALRGALSKAIEWKLLTGHPLDTVKHSKVDKAARVRYLSPEEDARLRAALDAWEAARRRSREKFNAWRRERGYKTFPDYISFIDHLKPITLLAALLSSSVAEVDLKLYEAGHYRLI